MNAIERLDNYLKLCAAYGENIGPASELLIEVGELVEAVKAECATSQIDHDSGSVP